MGFSVAKRAVVLLVAVLVMTTIAAQSVFAEGSGLILTDPSKELDVAPGTSQKITYELRNVSGTDIVAKAEVNDFTADDKTGEPKIFPTAEKKVPASIRDFVSGVSDLQLKKDEKKKVEVTITVPKNAVPGAYYGVIRYAAVPVDRNNTGESKISLTASVGELVLLTIPGDIVEQIQVRSLQVGNEPKANDFRPGNLFFKKPTKVAIDIKNLGTGFSKPFGSVSVSKGGKEIQVYELNQADIQGNRRNVLPGHARVFIDNLKNVKSPGRYKIVANVSHGNGGEVVTKTVSFWYIPQWLAIGGIVLLVVLLIAGFLVYKKFSRPNRRR